MKIIRIILVIAAFAAANEASAQFSVGAKAGWNFNSFRGNRAYDVVPGANGGAVVRLPVFSFLTARVEALYMQQGARLNNYAVLVPDLVRTRSRVAFHNVQVPVLAEFGLPSLNEDNLQPKLLIGGFYSYTVYARETYNNLYWLGGYGKLDIEGSSDFTPYIERMQYGFIAAVAADVKVMSVPMSIEFRYQYNLNRVNRPGTQDLPNLRLIHARWGNDLYLATLSINVAATLFYF